MVSAAILLLASALIFLALVSFSARDALLKQMRRLPGMGNGNAGQLAPAELAYLLRDGDMAHTLIVMSVDLVQRAVKMPAETVPAQLRPYEKQVWLSVKDFLRQLAEQKAGHLVPISDIKNPLKWVMRANSIKRFMGESLRSFVVELVKDPRHIRKYFSIAGIARLSVQLYTSSVRGAVEREMREELLRAGLLVPELRRKQFAQILIWLIPFLVAGPFFVNYAANAVPMGALAVYLLLGALNAMVLRLVASLPGFVPTYDEFARVSAELKRGGVRLTAIRAILKVGKFILYALIGLICLVLLAAELAISTFILYIPPTPALYVIIPATILSLVMVALALDWHSLSLREQASMEALRRVKEVQNVLSQVTPIQSFTKLFGDGSYDPTFSHLVACYGIETLWLLS